MTIAISEAEQLLLEEIVIAKRNVKESFELDQNSYGNGYDQGKLEGLRAALKIVMRIR